MRHRYSETLRGDSNIGFLRTKFLEIEFYDSIFFATHLLD